MHHIKLYHTIRYHTILCLCILIGTAAYTQIKIDRQYFIQLLNQGKYNEAFSKAMEIRKMPYGKNAVIDYFIAKSLCMKGLRDQSVEWLDYIDQHYPLQKQQRDFIQSEKQVCGQPARPATQPGPATMSSIIYINYAPLPEAGVMGKGGFTMECHYKEPSSNSSTKTLEELESRLFKLDRKKEALTKIKSIVGNDYDVDTSGRFIVVSLKSNAYTKNDVQQVSKRLENAYQYFLSFYQLKPSDKLFTVYLVPGKRELQKAAILVHDVVLAQNIIGYSTLGDLSLLGIADPNGLGTLYHELFHLTIRTEVGDVPPWLDEGIASMYAVYKLDGNNILGAKNTWRVNHFKLLTQLAKGEITVPTLEQLINMRWNEFEGGEKKNICVASIHYALSNMFLLYLQDKDIVDDIVDAYKNRLKTRKDSLEVGISNTELVEKVTSKSMAELSTEFYTWLDKTYNINYENILKAYPYTTPDQQPAYLFYHEPRPPVHIEQAFARIDSMIYKLKKDSLIATNEINTFEEHNRTLEYNYRNIYEELVYLNREELRAASSTGGKETVKPTEIKTKEEQLAAIETKIQTLERDLSTKLKQNTNN
ncbi:hypothetical protein OCK74_12420 [Chitinophagaceae bacterium LB-8]|uniref:Uncharacterized protein n=1 Tax=Paraflavisolibacter caeni TaxID=2982496 RepID=A0A9X2XNY0_9BACT|nr:hypothetical protein [Paraflavisolibacter caeni]MCU7549928.1 hypothetical protein [Paraflavisolibacter caeni]